MYRLVRRLSTAAVLLLAACQTDPEPPARQPAADARIERIERGLIPIDARNKDNGAPRTVEARMKELGVPGFSVAVFDGGEIIWAKGYGARDVHAGAPVTATTLFQAASISKPVASAALYRLVDRGDLTLDENVNDRLRRWKVPDNEFTATEKVTPRRIITHTAGLSGHGFPGYGPGKAVPTTPQILDGLAPANSPPVRVTAIPGAQEIYSGGGFAVLQLLMEDVSGRRFADLLQELVLRPAGMTHSTFAQPLPPALASEAATAYETDRKRATASPVAGRYSTYPELAAAGLWTTPSDLARFMLAIGRSYRGESGGFLSQASARTMLTKLPPGSGQGFGLTGEGEAFRYRHNGGNAGFTCYAVAFAGEGRGVVLMTNSDAGDELMHEMSRAISREYGWPPLWRGE